ncbi:hypothetical protein BGX26_004847 [Mortierella sp. AD094]|nr:hypothetical protein BGX26_004847 [Mortierella sp. AD094]
MEDADDYLQTVIPGKGYQRKPMYHLLRVIVEIFFNNRALLDKSKKTTELELLRNVLAPILDHVIRGMNQIEGCSMRFMTGESTRIESNMKKPELYDVSELIAFKIDGRVIIDREGEEFDIVARQEFSGCEYCLGQRQGPERRRQRYRL